MKLLKMFNIRFVSAFVVFLVIVSLVFVTYRQYAQSSQRLVPIVYSKDAMLLELWESYKLHNLDSNTHRAIDNQQGGITTSEGEGYTMLRATWMDDQLTFDQNWLWTQNNLQRPDKLFSWKYGPLLNGQYGIQSQTGGQNTASDGDTDIALSLLMAYSRWGDTSYLIAARQIIPSIWENEVVHINDKPVISADDLGKNNIESVIVNPSYFAPYAYKTFAKVDPTHPWNALSDNSYKLLATLSKNNLDFKNSDGILPDWVKINRLTGELSGSHTNHTDDDYSYDAMRTPFRLALDYQWFKDSRDKTVLDNFYFLQKDWRKNHTIISTYAQNGTRKNNDETPAVYGASIGYFIIVDMKNSRDIYQKKLLPLYNPDTQDWRNKMSYYDDNWAWFGMALYNYALPNLTERTS
ncbi:MAG: hypothetical protein NVSMB46_06190 [Candidatus Saccharimonadales bacterium]